MILLGVYVYEFLFRIKRPVRRATNHYGFTRKKSDSSQSTSTNGKGEKTTTPILFLFLFAYIPQNERNSVY